MVDMDDIETTHASSGDNNIKCQGSNQEEIVVNEEESIAFTEPRKNPYTHCFLSSIDFVTTYYHDLFDEDSLTLLNELVLLRCKNSTSLTDGINESRLPICGTIDTSGLSVTDISDIQAILSRVILRKPGWLKTSSFSNYFRRDHQKQQQLASSEDERSLMDTGKQQTKEIARIVDMMVSCQILQVFNAGTLSNDDLFDCIACTLTNDELRELCKVLDVKCKGNKDETMSHLFKVTTTQRTLMNSSPIKRIPAIVKKMLMVANPLLSDIVRINPSVLRLLRRVSRLLQITSIGNSGVSTLSPINFNAPLLVVCKKVRFPDYSITPGISLFRSRKSFEQFEAANELFYAFNAAGTFDKRVDGVGEYSKLLKSDLQRLNRIHSVLVNSIGAFQNDAAGYSLAAIADILLLESTNRSKETSPSSLGNTFTLKVAVALVIIACFCHYCIGSEETHQENHTEFLSQINAGHLLAELCHDCVSLFDTNNLKNYEVSCALLELLLASPFSVTRRGQWYIRLSIDYSHIGCDASKISSLLIASLKDQHVKMGDRMNLVKRCHAKLSAGSSHVPKPDQTLTPVDVQPPLNTSVFLKASLPVPTSMCNEDNLYRCHLWRIIFIAEKEYFNTGSQLELCSLPSSSISGTSVGKRVAASSHLGSTKVFKIDIDGLNTAQSPILHSTHWSCSVCTFLNISEMNVGKCAICESPRDISIRQQPSPLRHINATEVVDLCFDSDHDESPPALVTNKSIDILPIGTQIDDRTREGNKKKRPLNSVLVEPPKPDDILNSRPRKRTCKKVFPEPSSSNVVVSISSPEISCAVHTGKDSGEDLQVLITRLQEDIQSGNRSEVFEQEEVCSLDLEQYLNLSSPTSSIHTWKPSEIVVAGRRFGDPQRKGKSKFCGSDDELVSVEEYIIRKCRRPDLDDSPEFVEAIGGGDWHGWHCEGSILYSIYGLLMWEVIYSDREGAFLTPYQDAPLDILYPSYFTTRRQLIDQRLEEISSYTSSGIIKVLGDSYRKYYNTHSRFVSWYFKLAALQLIAVCIGGKGLCSICRALSVSYRHFRSGAPDLLLIRITKIVDGTHVSSDELSGILGDTWSDLSTTQPKQNSNVNKNSDWNSLGTNTNGATTSLSNGNSSSPGLNSATKSYDKSTIDGDSSALDATENEDHLVGHSDVDVLETGDLLTEEESLNDNLLDADAHPKRVSRFVTSEEDLAFSDNHLAKFSFEAMFVEVKGPSDHLAEKQIMWLLVLASSGLKSFVGRVIELKDDKRDKQVELG